MAGFTAFIRKHYRVHTDSWREDIKARKDKEFFRPTGTQIFVGEQGSGKTISAVKTIVDVLNRYPKAILVSNLNISGLEKLSVGDYLSLESPASFAPTRQYIHFQQVPELEQVLTLVNNGKFGVVYLIDEIHTYFNSKDSKEMPIWVFQQISQQRKQRKLIVGTSQLFLRVSKPFREQCDHVIVCRTLMGVITLQHAYTGASIAQDYDGKLTGQKVRSGVFVHNEKIRNFYDTYQVINSGTIEFETLVRESKEKQRRNFVLGRK